jgi:hypothetical protein
MYFNPKLLERIVVPAFFGPILLGGLGVLVLVAVRAVAVWQLSGQAATARAEASHDHGHSHSHGHEHSHSHGHAHAHAHDENCGHDHGTDCGHDHGKGHAEEGHDDHEHGWTPVRYMVLAIPFFLFILGEPRRNFSANEVANSTSGVLQLSPKRQGLAALAGGPALTRVLKKSDVDRREIQLRFNELVEAAAVPVRQEHYDGDIGIIRGQFFPIKGNDTEFTLFRVDMTCCNADARILETRISSPVSVQSLGLQEGEWIRARGVISFERDERKRKWVPVLTLQPHPGEKTKLDEKAVTPAESTTDMNAV